MKIGKKILFEPQNIFFSRTDQITNTETFKVQFKTLGSEKSTQMLNL